MNGRTSSTVWTVVAVNAVALLTVLGLAFSAGAKSGGVSFADAITGTPGLAALAVVAMAVIFSVMKLNGLASPNADLGVFAEKLAAGSFESRLENTSELAVSLN